jgi:protein-disulfide isomerase
MKSWSLAILVALAVGLGTVSYFHVSRDALPSLSTPAMAAEPVASTSQSAAASFSEEQKTALRGLVRDLLLDNPEIIREALEALQAKEEAAEVAAASQAIAGEPRIFTSDREIVVGNPKGDTTLVEFFDYNCGYCKRAHADMKRLLEEDKNLRVVLKEFPILSPGSVEAAQVGAAVAIVAPDKYWEFHDALITERGQVDGARAMAVVEDLGLDAAKIKEVSQSDDAKATIQESHELAEKLSITGTPSYVTHKELVVGAVGYDTLKAKLDEARKACGSVPC